MSFSTPAASSKTRPEHVARPVVLRNTEHRGRLYFLVRGSPLNIPVQFGNLKAGAERRAPDRFVQPTTLVPAVLQRNQLLFPGNPRIVAFFFFYLFLIFFTDQYHPVPTSLSVGFFEFS